MLDKSIPYYNIIMRYDGPPLLRPPDIPESFKLSTYETGDECRWSQMEVDNNDFDTYENGIKYFNNKYLTNPDKLKERFIGVRDQSGKLVGSVICWDDERSGELVSSVHWLVTDPSVQGNGVGSYLAKMLVYKFSKLELLPIYLHTQPWSYTAVGIYSNAGFRLLKTDSFRGYENQTELALPVLKQYMTEKKYSKLIQEMI